jgi:hypothetical protein
MARWQFHFTKPSSKTSNIVFRGARRDGHGPWLKGSGLPWDVFRYLSLYKAGKRKWVCGGVKSLAEFKSQVNEIDPTIKWNKCSDGIMGTVEVPSPTWCEETNILADSKALRRLELIVKEAREEYDCTEAEIYEVHSFGWSDSEEDEEGRLGIREIILAGRNSLFVKIEGNVFFPKTSDPRRCKAEERFLCKECEGYEGYWICKDTWEGFECFFFERVIISIVLKNGKLDKFATTREVTKAADHYCDKFESRMLHVTGRLEAYRKRLDSQKRRNSQRGVTKDGEDK